MEKTEKNTIEKTKENELVELKDDDLKAISAGENITLDPDVYKDICENADGVI
ncbi:MAG: hypothetical protein MJ247_06135 [Alphaproteobacteria bacterium]|nr:hypothetical protein [Alphaproteobacteria bacterium]